MRSASRLLEVAEFFKGNHVSFMRHIWMVWMVCMGHTLRRCTVMEISSIPNYLVYSIKRLSTPKVNKLQSPKLRLTQSLLVATLTQNFMRFHCMVMEILPIPNYLVYSIKRLPTPKVNKLQSAKLRLRQALLVATFTQNFMRFRCTVMEKCHQNFPPHSSVCDDRYHTFTFAWDKLCALFTPH